MDALFEQTEDDQLVLLPQTLPIISKHERFSRDKFESFECLARNCALLWGILFYCQPYNGSSFQAVVIDSGFNMSSFYCMLAANILRCDIEVHAISNSVDWMYYGPIDTHTHFNSYNSVKSAFSHKTIVPEIVFLDACNCAHTLLGDIFTTLDSMNSAGGVWGISFNTTRHIPTETTLKKRKIVSNIGPYDGKETLRDWMLLYCVNTGIRAKFHLSLYWEDKNNGVITFLFRVTPRRVEPQMVSSFKVITGIWSLQSNRQVLLNHGGVMFYHLLRILGERDEYATFLETLESEMRACIIKKLQTKSLQELLKL